MLITQEPVLPSVLRRVLSECATYRLHAQVRSSESLLNALSRHEKMMSRQSSVSASKVFFVALALLTNLPHAIMTRLGSRAAPFLHSHDDALWNSYFGGVYFPTWLHVTIAASITNVIYHPPVQSSSPSPFSCPWRLDPRTCPKTPPGPCSGPGWLRGTGYAWGLGRDGDREKRLNSACVPGPRVKIGRCCLCRPYSGRGHGVVWNGVFCSPSGRGTD